MSLQVFDSEQDAVDYANTPDFAAFLLGQWGLSAAHAALVAGRLIARDCTCPGDSEWLKLVDEARASFVRMARP